MGQKIVNREKEQMMEQKTEKQENDQINLKM